MANNSLEDKNVKMLLVVVVVGLVIYLLVSYLNGGGICGNNNEGFHSRGSKFPNVFNKEEFDTEGREISGNLGNLGNLGKAGVNYNDVRNLNYEQKDNTSINEQGKPNISYIDQFPEPKNMEQGNFLQKLSDNLEGSENKVITKLPVGSSIIANNYFWLHGRKPFEENKELSRELLRIRGTFFI